jgi:hypothetical protein
LGRGVGRSARRVFSQRLNADRDCPVFLVVRNVNRWDDAVATERYALAVSLCRCVAVSLWRDEDRSELHAELEAQLEAIVELPVEIELEL